MTVNRDTALTVQLENYSQEEVYEALQTVYYQGIEDGLKSAERDVRAARRDFTERLKLWVGIAACMGLYIGFLWAHLG